MFEKLLSDKRVLARYTEHGARFGDFLSYSYLGVCVGYKRLLQKYKKWEKIYASRGYRTIPLSDFIDYGGGYVETLRGTLIKRNPDEDVVFHAEEYEDGAKTYTGPTLNIKRVLDGEIVIGDYDADG